MSKSKSTLSAFRNRQQIKDEQINYLPGDLEKNLEDYRNALEIKEKQLSDAKKYYFRPNKPTIKLLLKTETLKHIMKV